MFSKSLVRALLIWSVAFALLYESANSFYVFIVQSTQIANSSSPVEHQVYVGISAIRFYEFSFYFCTFFAVFLYSERKKRIVMFLRKFYSEDLNLSMRRFSIKNARQGFRVIVLDDGDFKPKKPSKALLALLIALGVFATVVIILITDFLTSFKEEYWQVWQVLRMTGFGIDLQNAVNIVINLLGIVIFIMVFFAVMGIRLSTVAKKSVRFQKDIDQTVNYFEKLRSRIRSPSLFAPPVTIVNTDDSLWEETVSKLAEASSIVLIDLSVKTENIKAELDILSETRDISVICLAKYGSETQWLADSHPGLQDKLIQYRSYEDLEDQLGAIDWQDYSARASREESSLFWFIEKNLIPVPLIMLSIFLLSGSYTKKDELIHAAEVRELTENFETQISSIQDISDCRQRMLTQYANLATKLTDRDTDSSQQSEPTDSFDKIQEVIFQVIKYGSDIEASRNTRLDSFLNEPYFVWSSDPTRDLLIDYIKNELDTEFDNELICKDNWMVVGDIVDNIYLIYLLGGFTLSD